MFRRSFVIVGLGLLLFPAAALAIEDPTRPADYSTRGVAVETSAGGTQVLQALLNGSERKVAVISGWEQQKS